MNIKDAFELIVLVAALFFGVVMAWIGIGFAGMTPAAFLVHSILIAAPLIGILVFFRERRRERSVP